MPLLTPQDAWLLFTTRVVRLFGYGLLSVVLVLYLAEVGFEETQIGVLLTLTLVGDTAVSLWLTTRADRFGRRRTLVVGAVLVVLAGAVFAVTDSFALLLVAATIGVISPSGNEVGPFLPIEQAALAQVVPDQQRTRMLAWYNLAGSLATAAGSLVGGTLIDVLKVAGLPSLSGYRALVVGYAILGAVLAALFLGMSAATEITPERRSAQPQRSEPPSIGNSHFRNVVTRLSALFALDAFAGGFVMQSIVAYWFHVRFGVSPTVLGSIFFGANILAGLSALAAARLASRIGLVNTMVFTHLPSNILLILVPLMPNLPLAITVLLIRFSISQMDVPTRQSYVLAIVRPEERSAAAGITGVARTTGAALAPVFAGFFLASEATLGVPFLVAGGLKIVYDLLLYRAFRKIKPPEEHRWDALSAGQDAGSSMPAPSAKK